MIIHELISLNLQFSSRKISCADACHSAVASCAAGYKQGARLKDIVDKLDPAVFPNAKDTIGKDEQLGRLNVYAQVNALTGAEPVFSEHQQPVAEIGGGSSNILQGSWPKAPTATPSKRQTAACLG
jgi:hypothetical protein